MRNFLIICAVISILAPSTMGRIRHVPADFATIQACINACFEDDTVLVAPGTYGENINYGGVNITVASLFITTGDSTYITSTIINGHFAGPVVTFRQHEYESAVLKGFTIKNGQAEDGGGILCVNSSPTISNNIIRENTAIEFGNGGGILCDSSASPRIMNNKFLENDAYYGAAIGCLNNSNSVISNNSFTGHTVESHGGAIYCNHSSPTIANNIFLGNSGNWGGAICCYSDSPARIKHNYFRNNTAYWGGAIYCLSSSAIIDSNTIIGNHASYDGGGINSVYYNPIITADSIVNNTADAFGGGINCTGVNKIANCYISGNIAENGGGIASWYGRITGNRIENNSASVYGGGILCGTSTTVVDDNYIISNSTNGDGGGIMCMGYSKILRNIIVGNTANRGGGLTCREDSQFVAHNIFTGNGADLGSALLCDGADIDLNNSILWADTIGGAFEIEFLNEATFSVKNCDIYGGFPGGGNINADPLFRNPEAGDYHLMAISCGDSLDSPCIDAGDRNYIDTLLNCQWGLGSLLCDIGAYGGRVPAGHTINVPDDHLYIQDAINASQDRDTILVRPGTYWERLNFYNKKIVLGSLFLITGDTSYISSTTIDGDSAGTVITISGRQDSSSAVIGFTIRNGYSISTGGGVYCYQSSPRICNNIIRDNLTINGGAGIMTYLGSRLICANNAIIHNRTISQNAKGGGIYCYYKFDRFTNNVVAFNEARGIAARGGGIYLSTSGSMLNNNTIVNNIADSIGGGIYCYSTAALNNDIIWGNEALVAAQIFANIDTQVSANYCDISGGWAGAGNINIEPLFRSPQSDDFRLMSVQCGYGYDSPCIDTGDPQALDSLLSCWWGLGAERSDMGAFGGGIIHPVSIEDEHNVIPKNFLLSQNYPNPFNAQTTIEFEISELGDVTIVIFNVLGQKVATLAEGYRKPGKYSLLWDASNFPSGLYFVRLSDGALAQTIKMVLLK